MIKDRVLKQRRRSGIYSETADSLSEIDAKIAEKSQEITWEVWDKTSPINGVPASDVLRRPDIPAGGEIYLVKRGDRVIYFQPHKPGVQGVQPITSEEMADVAGEHYEEIVAADVVLSLVAPAEMTELETAKAQKLASIADARWRTETAPFYWVEKNARFDTSERSQVKYLQAAQKGKTQMWKTADGWVEMQPGDFVDLITAYETFIEELFTREATLAAQVQAAQTVPDVDAIEW